MEPSKDLFRMPDLFQANMVKQMIDSISQKTDDVFLNALMAKGHFFKDYDETLFFINHNCRMEQSKNVQVYFANNEPFLKITRNDLMDFTPVNGKIKVEAFKYELL